MKGYFDNSGKLVRFMLKRERITAVVWIVILAVFSVVLAPGMDSMFQDAEARTQVASIYDNPIMAAMMGPVYGADNFTSGAMYSSMMLLWVIIAVGIMNIFLVLRYTRADEEKGRAEVIRSLPVGRLANINAAMITAVIINLILGLLTGIGIALTGVEGMDLMGSLLYGAVLFASGLVFAAVTALFCQLSSNTSGATGLSFLSLGIFYMIRAAGDMYNSDLLACISPLGLAQRSQIYVKDHWWPALILLIEAAVIFVIAYKLNSIRDLDQGFIAARPGRKDAPKILQSSFGLAFRLLRTALIAWFVVMLTLGASYGSVIGDIDKFVADSPDYLKIIGIPEAILDTMSEAEKGQIIVDYFGVFVTSMMTLVCIVPLINAVMKLRSEEKDNRAEHILSRVVTRKKYLGGYVILAFTASVFIQCATAVGLYSSVAATVGGDASPFTFGGLMQAYMAYLPALWVMIGIAVLLIGAFPKASGAIWGYFGFVCFVSFIGGMLDLPKWLLSVSPLHHIPQLPLDEMTVAPLIVLTITAAILTAAGFIFYTKRDTQA